MKSKINGYQSKISDFQSKLNVHQPFDLLSNPLTGAHLIEASAGTGKTYAIAGLYVRLILERALPVREILVVTFTLAATAELKDRIRRKLRDTLEAFEREDIRDEFLQALVETFPDSAARREACERLHAALRDFDESAIFTIHGFCRRMLHEYAFESGTLFDAELVTDQRRLKEEIIQDFWRTRFYEVQPELVGYAVSQGLSPASWMSLTGNIALHPDIRVLPDGEPPSPESIRNSVDAFHEAIADLQTHWPGTREEVLKTLQDPALKANIYNRRTAERLVKAMDEWLVLKDVVLFEGFDKMTPESIAKACRKAKLNGYQAKLNVQKNAVPPEHPVFELCRTVREKAGVLRSVFDRYLLYMKADLVRTLRVELPARKQKRNILFFDDLLLRLRDALEIEDYCISKEGGSALASAIGNQFKAALIDEFQDTDPVQYAIFRAVFGREDHTIFLIGDPKQAIYSFRGADIFAYMQAANDIRAVHTLDKNWRSEPGLITAVNTLFSRNNKPFVYKEISFRPAAAAPISGRDAMTIQGRHEAPMEWWFLPSASLGETGKPLSKETARRLIADAVAAEISHLVQMGRERLALIGRRPLREGDIVVLVRTNSEARLIQQALRALQIHGTLASEENVFESREARELSRVLQGIAWPAHEEFVRGALATDMMGAGGTTLEKWLRDDAGWSVRLETFRHDHNLWEQRGFMQMFRTLMAREDVRNRLLTFPDGERRLTNILHLSEILHQESITRKLDGKRLLQWLVEQLDSEQRELRDDHLLRLESDANAVTITTIHKSKGLEYPVVFCPFAFGSSRIAGGPFYFHDETHCRELTLDLGSANINTHRFSAERERLSENCRMLYVALTRARHRCYFVWGNINGTGSSAPAYLFHMGKAGVEEIEDYCLSCREEDLIGDLETKMAALSDRDMQNDLARIAAESGGTIRMREISTMHGIPLAPPPDAPDSSSCRKFQGHIDASWKVASYSMLVSAPAALLELPDRDAIDASLPTPESAPPYDKHEASLSTSSPQDGLQAGGGERTIFNFPGGVRAGILLHDILEQVDFTERNVVEIRRLVAQKLQIYGFDRHWEETLTDMLQNVAACPLSEPSASKADRMPMLTLSRISKSARINELEFYFPLQMLSRERLKHLFHGDETKETGLERLNFNPVRGFMRGFIDLVFEHAGRFYLVDWKSNILGPVIADYAPARLRKAMEGHFYVLQSRLYAVALHQYLTLRLPHYRYEKHFGGIYYLFIRGMNPAYGLGFGIYADRPEMRFMDKFARFLIGGKQ